MHRIASRIGIHLRTPFGLLLLWGVFQIPFSFLRPDPIHFSLTPIGLWSILGPWMMLRSQEKLPPLGPPHWTRRLLFWLGRETQQNGKWLAAFSVLTLVPHLPHLAALGIADTLYEDWVVMVPAALSHWAIHMGFVFLVLSYSLPRRSTVATLLGMGLAGRALVEGAAASGWAAWQELEIQWIVIKGLGLVWCAMILDWRARRDLANPGLLGLVGEVCAIPRMTRDALSGPLGRISQPNWRSWWMSPVVTLGVVGWIEWWTVTQAAFETLAGTAVVCVLCLGLLIREASRSLGGLRETGFLSEILLTLIRPGDVVAARAAQCLRPFRWCLGFHFLAMAAVHFALKPLWAETPHVLFLMTGCVATTLAVGHLILGPYLNHSLRSRMAIEAFFKTTVRLIGVECVIVFIIYFLILQGAAKTDRDTEAIFYLQIVLFPHTLLFLWVYDQWQKLLLDFEGLAHGRIEVKRKLATREEVDAFRKSLETPTGGNGGGE